MTPSMLLAVFQPSKCSDRFKLKILAYFLSFTFQIINCYQHNNLR